MPDQQDVFKQVEGNVSNSERDDFFLMSKNEKKPAKVRNNYPS